MDFSLRNYGFHKRNFYKKLIQLLKTKYGENLEEGSLGGTQIDQHVESGCLSDEHLVIVTYWKSFDQHEKSHADPVFKEKFSALMALCEDTFEIGYEMLWQGEPEAA